MEVEKPIEQKPETSNGDSKLVGISLRGWLALILTMTCCMMSMMRMEVKEPLYSSLLVALAFYFGQKSAKP